MKYAVLIFTLLVITLIPLRSEISIAASDVKKIDVIVLDAGHGGKDPGTIGTTGFYEKNVVLPITNKVKALLEKNYPEVKLVLTREDDKFIELWERGKIANANEGKLFVSIHANAKKKEENDKNGFEIYILDVSKTLDAINITKNDNMLYKLEKNAKSDLADSTHVNDLIFASLYQNAYLKSAERFSSILQSELAKGTQIKSNGILQQEFVVLIGASMPSVLVECGYLSNSKDEDYLKSEKGQDDIANSIYKSIVLFKYDYEFENKSY